MSLLDMLQNQLSGEHAGQVSQRIGVDPTAGQKAIGAALPALMAALAGNARGKEGAAKLAQALERDHDGSILDDLPGFLSRGDTRDGEGILKHALGSRRPAVEAEVAKQTGLDAKSVSGLLPLLAPLVMGALGRQKQRESLDTGGLSSLLAGEGKRAKEVAPGALGLLGSLLDDEGDGLDAGDLADAGKKFLGGLMRGRK
jgi:hypothetical protein